MDSACCVWLIIFREPVSRLKSAFTTSQDAHQHFDCLDGPLRRRLRNRRRPLTLEQLAMAPAHHKRSCRLNAFLDQLAPPVTARERRGGAQRARLRRALTRLDAIQIVGLQERLSETLLLVADRLRFELPRNFSSVFTYNPRVGGAANLSSHAEAMLRRDLAPDLALYARAVSRFEELLARSPRPYLSSTTGSGAPSLRCEWGAARCWSKDSTAHLRRTIDARRDASAIAAPPSPAVPTWPISEVAKSPLWRGRGRRQRTLCAAPCVAPPQLLALNGAPAACAKPGPAHDPAYRARPKLERRLG